MVLIDSLNASLSIYGGHYNYAMKTREAVWKELHERGCEMVVGIAESQPAESRNEETLAQQPTGDNTSKTPPVGEIKRECSTCDRKRYGTCDPSLCDTGYSGWIPA